MTKIVETIDNLISQSWGGIIIFWLILLNYLKKFLCWVGKQISKGAVEEVVEKLFPHIEEKIDKKFEEMECTLKEEFKKDLKPYKEEKHRLEGENAEMRDAIENDDHEKLIILRKHFKNGRK